MKKKLRMTSLIMLIIAIVFVVCAFLTMDSTITFPHWVYDALRGIYKVYPVVMIGLFAVSFFVKDRQS